VDTNFTEHLASNFYFDRHFNRDAAKILPGEYFVSNRGVLLVTVLGSCVAACIQDGDAGLGGMNHFMLPDDGRVDAVGASARYGTYAMEILVNHLLKMGAKKNRLQAKVFGGGAVLASLATSNVGQRNSEFVVEYLKTEKIPIISHDLQDVYPRKVYFFTDSGRVLVKRLNKVPNTTLIDREQAYRKRLTEVGVEGEVELFI